RTLTNPLPPPARVLAEATGGLRIAVSDYLVSSAASVSQQLAPPSLAAVDKALLAFRHSLDGLRQSGALRELHTEDVERLFSFPSALEQLRRTLGDLGDRLAERATRPRPASRD